MYREPRDWTIKWDKGCATSKPWLSGRCGFTSDFFSWINGIVTPSTKAATHYCSNLRTCKYIAQQLQKYASIRYRIRIKSCTNISEGTDQQFHGSDKIWNIQSSCWRVQSEGQNLDSLRSSETWVWACAGCSDSPWQTPTHTQASHVIKTTPKILLHMLWALYQCEKARAEKQIIDIIAHHYPIQQHYHVWNNVFTFCVAFASICLC